MHSCELSVHSLLFAPVHGCELQNALGGSNTSHTFAKAGLATHALRAGGGKDSTLISQMTVSSLEAHYNKPRLASVSFLNHLGLPCLQVR